MNKSDHIFIAGHRGLVGGAIVRELQDQGYENLVLRTRQETDLRDPISVKKLFKNNRIDYVFLAAAKVGGILANNTERADFLLENLQIQNNVIAAAHEYKVKKLLFLGSTCIYPKLARIPITEDQLLTGPLEYTNEPYAVAKIAGIKLCESFNLQYGTNFIAAMPTNLYGPGDNFDLQRSHVLPALIRKFLLAYKLDTGDLSWVATNLGTDSDRTLDALEQIGIVQSQDEVNVKLWGSGAPLREFMHSEDLARACVHLMQHYDFDQRDPGSVLVNVGTGQELSIRDLAMLVADVVGFTGNIEWDTSKPDGTMRKGIDSSRLLQTGFDPSVDLKTGISRIVKDYERQFRK